MSKIMTAEEFYDERGYSYGLNITTGTSIKLAESYAKYVIKATLPEKVTVKHTSTENPSVDGWNECIDQIKQNAGIE